MRADRILELSVDRSPGGDRFDRQLVRSLAGVSPGRLNDAKLDTRLVSAARHVERNTGLKLFPGKYRAEFRYATLIRNRNYAFRPAMLPGCEASATAVRLGDTDIMPSVTLFSDGLISQYLYPPARGWFDGYAGDDCPSLVVDFDAGATLPAEMQELVGITFRWLYDHRPEDGKILEKQYPLWQPRDGS